MRLGRVRSFLFAMPRPLRQPGSFDRDGEGDVGNFGGGGRNELLAGTTWTDRILSYEMTSPMMNTNEHRVIR